MQQQLPNESFLYLGDMARLPYGTKNPDTITRYSLQVCHQLIDQGVKMLVVACNTASALALPTLQKQLPDIPIVGVLAPGAKSAVETTKSGHIAIIATESTVSSNSYTEAILQLRSDAIITTASCSMFVALVEEGWVNGDITHAVVRHYLDPLIIDPIDTLVLGCTHFPALNNAIRAIIPSNVQMVNSAVATADVVSRTLTDNKLQRENKTEDSTVRFLVTDSPDRFIKISQHLLPYSLDGSYVELIDLNGATK